MTQLNQLHSKLLSLRTRRGVIRLVTALSALLIALLWLLGIVFVLDVVFEMTVLQRLAVFAFGAIVMVCAYVQFAAPWFGIHETTTDMALFVERQQQIDSDLVAAMQFESVEAPRWGSVQLERAVIDYVGQFSRGLNVFSGMNYTTFARRGLILVVTLAVAAGVVALFPAHARVFAARLLLSPAHYPTKTVIESIEVNGKPVPVSPRERIVVRVGYGQPVQFAVRCSGRIPEKGKVRLRTVGSGTKKVELEKIDEQGGGYVFRGQRDRLRDEAKYKIYLGDAWTDPRSIRVIPLPVVQPRLTVVPPKYAREAAAVPPGDAGALQLSVLEGSQVKVEFESTKPLTEAILKIENGVDPKGHRLVQVDKKALRWALQASNKETPFTTPFDRVESPIRFDLTVTDTDGLQLESPLKGYVRLKSDRRPQVTGSIVHRVVLPDAKPVIELRASDDYGISVLALNVRVDRSRDEEGGEGTSTQPVADRRILVNSLLEPAANGLNGASSGNGGTRNEVPVEFPARGEVLPIVGGFRLDLTEFDLVKGDRLRLTLEAIDYRGDLESGLTGDDLDRWLAEIDLERRLAESEPMIIEVSDESGVLAAISEVDEQSEERITELIRRELGIGESP